MPVSCLYLFPVYNTNREQRSGPSNIADIFFGRDNGAKRNAPAAITG
jgi:hypothetical protein